MIPNYEIHALSQIKGIGPFRIHKICNYCKHINSIEDFNENKLLNIDGITKSIYNPPIGIFARGKIQFEKPIAIIGSINIAQYGKKITSILTSELIANGLDICSPSENKILFKQMCKNASFLSEYSLGHKPEAMYFPKRNRIISGLLLGTIVIEALITAYNVLEQNRDVFAVPGRIF